MTPTHQTKNSAGADLHAAETVTLQPGETKLISTGAYVPSSHRNMSIFYMLSARSSVAFFKRLLLSNGVGVIDADYPDEIKCMYTNLNTEAVTIERGDRIAQLIPMMYVSGVFQTLDNERNGGFGSTNENQ